MTVEELQNAYKKDSFTIPEGNDSLSDEMPNFYIDEMPYVKIKEIRVENYKIFDKFKISFEDNNSVKDFACFIGPNGYGKSTTLQIIQSIFSNYNSYEEDRLVAWLSKSIRHVDGISDPNGDFLIEADLVSSMGEYTVSLNKHGFIKDHPKELSHLLSRICYYTKFDQELKQFNLRKDKWAIFKELFEAVTGFEIEEEVGAFSIGGSSLIDEEFIFGFYVKKPNETIYYKECSDGERKIMKSFSTLLSLEYSPSVILIDNVEMHVESGRHLPLIQAMKKCFNESQIITTTHSYHISRNFCDKNNIYDLRLLSCKDIFKEENWRLQVLDEIKDYLIKINNLESQNNNLFKTGKKLLSSLEKNNLNKDKFKKEVYSFFSDVLKLYIEDLIK
jgi:ABC-type cobalamin/Fe3+-siderophores transport system ATPase subunit